MVVCRWWWCGDFNFLLLIFDFLAVIFSFPMVILYFLVVILCLPVVILWWWLEVVVARNGGRWWLEVADGGTRVKMVINYLKINIG